jgi:RNA polymerase primary sigma factor
LKLGKSVFVFYNHAPMKDSLDPVTLYFQGIKNLPAIAKEEFEDLWKRASKNDKVAKKRLTEGNLRLVIPIAKKYYRPGIDFLDLIEEGNLGLMHAVEKFDYTRGFRFSTYAAYWIEQAVRRAIDEQSKTIRIPPHAWEALRKWLKEWDHMHGALGRDPTLVEMAKKLHLSARQIRGVLDAAEAAKGLESLDNPLDDDEDLFVKDIVAEKEDYAPDNVLSELRMKDELEKCMGKVGDRERKILEMRFGLAGSERMTLELVGKKLRLSRERVRQLEERGLQRLRRAAQRMGLI